jgi:hypothetical protein
MRNVSAQKMVFALALFLFCFSTYNVYAAGNKDVKQAGGNPAKIKFDTMHSPTQGPANAPIELITFLDFE